MKFIIKLFITSVLLLLAFAVGQNLFNYLEYGGLKWGFISNTVFVLFHAITIVTSIACIPKTWKFL